MRRTNPFPKIALLAGGVLVFSACLRLQINRHVDDPRPYFDRAYREIERLEGADPSRGRGIREICLLAHDASDGELVRASVPFWLFLPVLEAGVEAVDCDPEAREWAGRYGFDHRALHHLGDFGPGLVVDIREDGDHVLVWLR